jgi:hypothetical protein
MGIWTEGNAAGRNYFTTLRISVIAPLSQPLRSPNRRCLSDGDVSIGRYNVSLISTVRRTTRDRKRANTREMVRKVQGMRMVEGNQLDAASCLQSWPPGSRMTERKQYVETGSSNAALCRGLPGSASPPWFRAR